MAKKTLLIIPTYYEEPNIEPLVTSIFAKAPEVCLLFVDDNSQDGTRAKIMEMAGRYQGKINILKRGAKLGLGSAYVAGFTWGLDQGFEILIEMDADLSHNPEHLSQIFPLLEAADFVVGSRYVRGGGTQNWSLLRQCISRAGSFYARTILGVPVKDFTGGFNAWHAHVLKNIEIHKIRSDGYVFQIELKYRAILAGFTGKETPIVFADRTHGKSKMSFGIVLEAVYKVFWLRFFQQRFKLLGGPKIQT